MRRVQGAAIRPAVSLVVRSHRPPDGVQHGQGVEGLAQVSGGSRLLDALERRNVVMGP
jgi:hypothetical protein